MQLAENGHDSIKLTSHHLWVAAGGGVELQGWVGEGEVVSRRKQLESGEVVTTSPHLAP